MCKGGAAKGSGGHVSIPLICLFVLLKLERNGSLMEVQGSEQSTADKVEVTGSPGPLNIMKTCRINVTP